MLEYFPVIRAKVILLFFLLLLPAGAWALEPWGDVSSTVLEYISDPDLVEALEMVEAGDSAGALQVLSYYVPGEDSGGYHLASALAQRADGKPGLAVEQFRLAYIYSRDDALRELALLELAREHFGMEYFPEARADLIIFTKEFPKSGHIREACLGLAESLMAQGLYKEAESAYKQAGAGPEALFGRACALNNLRKYLDADSLFRKAIHSHEDYFVESDRALYHYGENLRILGRLFDSRTHLLAVREGDYKDMAELSLGKVALAENRLDEAFTHFKAAKPSEAREVRVQARLGLARAYIRDGKTDEAKQHLIDIRKNYPFSKGYDEAVIGLARLLRREGEHMESVSLLKELVFRRLPRRDALEEFEGLLLELKDKDRAAFLSVWGDVGALLMERSREDTLLVVARTLMEEGEVSLKLLRWLSRYGSLRTRSQSDLELAKFYVKVGRLEKAKGLVKKIKLVRKIKTVKGMQDEINRLEAAIFEGSGDPASAAGRIMRIKEISAGDVALMSRVLEHAKSIKKAIAFYREALGAVDADAEEYLTLADILYRRGNRKEALKYYKAALEKDAQNDWAAYRTGSLLGRDAEVSIFEELERHGSIYGKVADSRLKEIKLKEKLKKML